MKGIYFCFLTAAIYSCAPNPYADANKKYKKQSKILAKTISAIPQEIKVSDSSRVPQHWAGTTNFGIRKPNFVIIHHTAQNSCEQTLKTFTLEKSQVSSHYVICKDGTLHHMLNDYLRAWHAGTARWGNSTDINSNSIGIEIDNNGFEVFTEAQINCLLGLLAKLKKDHNIPTGNFIGHGDIAPGRKVDPNVNFPWQRLSENGFGHWYSDTTGVEMPADFNPVYALRIIGYDISNITTATQAFRRHFIHDERNGELTEPEKKVLYMVMQKYF
jgi:N-acetylmuramoyl-L-alanine amidase